jgi:DNA-binding MurR/RpiR family transcriptional regulator
MFISVKEAVELTGMSQTTIYRLCKKRSHTKFVQKKDNKFFIEKEYLLAAYPAQNEVNVEDTNTEYTRTALNTPDDELIEFTDDESTEFSEKVISDIADKITERFNQAGNELIEEQNVPDQTKKIIPWEMVIGVSVGLLLITGFILMLYFSSK